MLVNLKQIRLDKGLTLKQLSLKTGLSTTYLNDLENLNRKNPSYKKLNKILEVLEVTIEQLEGKY